MNIHGVVMAGGSGERFWPVSTPARPKQLLDLTGEGSSMLYGALERLRPVVGSSDRLWISTSTSLAVPIREEGLVDERQILAEPARRNTAGAALWTMAHLAADEEEDFLVAFTTADHAIRPTEAFVRTVRIALETAAANHALVVIGIPPTRPDTGYGYIEVGSDREVVRFTEKPNAETAAKFLSEGRYLWNSGMFFWRESAFAKQLGEAAPTHAAIYEHLKNRVREGDADGAVREFERLPSVSIDVALMEKSHKVNYVPAQFTWDDLGTWDALLRTVPLDAKGNAVIGAAGLLDSAGCVVYNTNSRKVWALGLENLVIVVTDEFVLVTRADRAQDVRQVAQASQAP